MDQNRLTNTAQKMKFSIKDFLVNVTEFAADLAAATLLKKTLMKNFSFSAVSGKVSCFDIVYCIKFLGSEATTLMVL